MDEGEAAADAPADEEDDLDLDTPEDMRLKGTQLEPPASQPRDDTGATDGDIPDAQPLELLQLGDNTGAFDDTLKVGAEEGAAQLLGTGLPPLAMGLGKSTNPEDFSNAAASLCEAAGLDVGATAELLGKIGQAHEARREQLKTQGEEALAARASQEKYLEAGGRGPDAGGGDGTGGTGGGDESGTKTSAEEDEQEATVAAMWSELVAGCFRFNLKTKGNLIASRWARHIKNKGNSDDKAKYDALKTPAEKNAFRTAWAESQHEE